MRKAKALQKVLLVPDSHHPYVDKQAWSLMLKAAKVFEPDIIVVLGDLLDCYSISSFAQDPARMIHTNFAKEIEAGNRALDELDSLGAKKKIFTEGNHENRLQKYLINQAPQLSDFVKIQDLLRLNERGWNFVPYRSHFKLGHLYLTHDAGPSGKTAAQRTGEIYAGNVAFGHSHRLQIIYSGNAKGETHVSANMGWLGDPSMADYAHIMAKKDWITSFGIAYMLKDGTAHIQGIPIVNNTVIIEGKVISL